MMRAILIHSLTLLFVFLLLQKGLAQNSKQSVSGYVEKGFVPDSATAIKIADAIWLARYGDGIYSVKPFVAYLKSPNIWVVHGTVPPRTFGGDLYIEIRKSDCKILTARFGK